MKHKLKWIVSAVTAFALATPVLVSAQFDPATGTGGTNLTNRSIGSILQTLLNWLLILVGVIGVLGFVVAGLMYLTAAGEEERIKKAKSAMVWSIVGIVVALIGLVIVTQINTLLTNTAPTL